jgi:hypothetical protein
VAVKQVRVSDLSGRQADEEQFAKLVVHQHPDFQGPITLDVLPEELGELPDSDQYVSIEVIGPGERSGQRAVLSVERFNQLARRRRHAVHPDECRGRSAAATPGPAPSAWPRGQR